MLPKKEAVSILEATNNNTLPVRVCEKKQPKRIDIYEAATGLFVVLN